MEREAAAGQAASAPGPNPPADFEAFWSHHYRYYLTVLMGIGATIEDAHDTISEVIVDMLKKNMWGRLTTNPRAWVRKAVLHTYYDQQKYADGLAALQHASTSGSATAFAPAIESIMGDGYAQQGKYKEAASHFAAAADRSPYPLEQARLRANAARAYANAGDVAAAVALWRPLAEDPKSGEAQEARLRLGELTAKAAGKS